ncbi:hypothetical protein Moror_5456 [Moniliophthora roreri MCA 2997]|uniref:Uncharacterized protein n=1 Tax=Moniliophthora roreri (strain MCA 2997) TaxID=1381753 RepID=V2XQG4_MONRO|nr:hypothetical protein Moror_5456 [Moniliophthora roreri MCA 2997]
MKPEILGMAVACVKLFFSFSYQKVTYPCALVEWFTHSMDAPDEETGLWVVELEYELRDGKRMLDVVHLDSVARPVHLLPVFGCDLLPKNFHFSEALNAFCVYYLNKFVKHASYEFIR